MKIAITGESGFLGYHLTQYYKWVKEYEIVKLGRNYLNNIKLLKDCDLLIHCAGVNRGNNIYQDNILLTQDLVSTLIKNNISIDIKFTSSTQENNDSEYGNSKLESKKILQNYCKDKNTKFESYKIPNIFGPFGKPNYNSFINTFCYNISKNLPCSYNDNLVELVKGKGSQTQIFFSITKPGITRGEHFHFNKIERFCILKGKAKISTRKIGDTKKNTYIINENDNKVIDMNILHTHNITNIGKEDLVCVFWVNEIFNPEDTDTYFLKV